MSFTPADLRLRGFINLIAFRARRRRLLRTPALTLRFINEALGLYIFMSLQELLTKLGAPADYHGWFTRKKGESIR